MSMKISSHYQLTTFPHWKHFNAVSVLDLKSSENSYIYHLESPEAP